MANEITPTKKIRKFRGIMAYWFFGFIIGVDTLIGRFLIEHRYEFFNIAVDYSRSIELGFVVLKGIMLVGILAVNLKILQGAIRQWKRDNEVIKVETREGKEEYKRLGLIKRLVFYWRVNGARKWMDKYHDEFRKMQKTIGRIRGDETKELKKLKREMIKGIMIWDDDFKITIVRTKKNGQREITNIPVTEQYLDSLYLDEIYELYLFKSVDTAERFINGYSDLEKEIPI